MRGPDEAAEPRTGHGLGAQLAHLGGADLDAVAPDRGRLTLARCIGATPCGVREGGQHRVHRRVGRKVGRSVGRRTGRHIPAGTHGRRRERGGELEHVGA